MTIKVDCIYMQTRPFQNVVLTIVNTHTQVTFPWIKLEFVILSNIAVTDNIGDYSITEY